MSIPHKIHTFTSEHKQYLLEIQSRYAKSNPFDIHSIKIGWLNGMMKKTHYDEHERRMLNKMVNKYNKKLG